LLEKLNVWPGCLIVKQGNVPLHSAVIWKKILTSSACPHILLSRLLTTFSSSSYSTTVKRYVSELLEDVDQNDHNTPRGFWVRDPECWKTVFVFCVRSVVLSNCRGTFVSDWMPNNCLEHSPSWKTTSLLYG